MSKQGLQIREKSVQIYERIRVDPYRKACLAIFLDITQAELDPSGNGGLYTVRGNEYGEYAIKRRPRDIYENYVGRAGQYYVYKLGGNRHE